MYRIYFKGRNFRGRKFREVKNQRHFKDKLSRMTNNNTFIENLTFADQRFKDLLNRINILLIDEKILNKRNKNLDSYYVNENTSPDNNNFQTHLIITFHLILPLTIQNFTIGFASSGGQSFKGNILQNLPENIIEIFDAVNFTAQCEDFVKT